MTTKHTNTEHTNAHGPVDAIRTRLDQAATALHAAATRQPQQVGVYLYCTHAVELLRAAEAAVAPRAGHGVEDHHRAEDHGVADADHSVGRAPDTPTLIRLALTSLAALPPEEFSRDPVLAAARAARRALRLTTEPADAHADRTTRPGGGAGPALTR